ncbi:hypothetical protein PGTUg99_004958 [Puccinia graminis f. sp. tritici]|uniref:U3 small nucleolar RNA-associated protein 14 n=1 Tax=Puccinia graminis f. sp. tritici TaxID=56615 RepID=A0A5B0PTA1_PUCGR|nr:hypothetical protein PGTUg99_004958 [Puccinia graminis f. sp. tritici]
MFRSARQGRQGKNNSNNNNSNKRSNSKNTHQHLNEPTKPKQGSASTKKSKQSTGNSKGDRIDEDHQFYDYQANSQSTGKRLTANQIDDHRLTGTRPSKGDDQEDLEIDDLARIESLVERCQQENDEGFGFVNSDDDESIDSDEADGELDQPKRKPKQLDHQKNNLGKRPNAKVRFEESETSSLSDGSEEETDLDQDEFIDASTMLDIGADSDHAFSDEEDGMSGSENSDRSSQRDNSEDRNIDLDELEDDEESRLNHLAKIVDNLDSLTAQKRKENSLDNSTDHPSDGPTKRRKLLPVQIESRTEGEILPSMSAGGMIDEQASSRVNLEDLLSNLSSTPGISELKKSLKPLITSNKSSKAGPIPAPLETRRQQQIERQAAYELTKKEMSKWDETTKLAKGLTGRNSDGKNRFVVPSNQISTADKEPDATRWNMHFNPLNNLESQVVGLIESSQITSKRLVQEENDQLISQGTLPEQIREKVLESKMARELMFRAERKAKRVAKIKSKAFRRIRKKEKQRKSISGVGGAEADMDFIQELDDIDGGDRVQTKTEEMELERARERASLKHSNQGKWAKKVAGLKGLGGDTNTAIQERIRREELLKKKISGRQGSDDSEDGSDSDSDFDSDAEDDVDAIRAHALKQLGQIDSKRQNSDDERPLKGLFAMKFMQNAMAVKERKAEEARLELHQQLLDDQQDRSGAEEEDLSGGMKVQGNPGRLVFNPEVCRQIIGPSTAGDDATTSDQDTSTHPAPSRTTKTSGSHLRVMAVEDKLSIEGISNPSKSIPNRAATEAESNPWLVALDSTTKGGTISRIKDLNPNSGKNADSVDVVAEKAKLKAEKRKRKQTTERELATEDAKVDLDFNAFLGGKSEGVGANALQNMQDQGDEDAAEDAIIRQGQTDSQGRSAFQQRELVKQAFADDGVVAQFVEEKRKQIEKEAPKEVDVTLPGWGDWVGKGGKKAKHSKKFVKKVSGVEPSKRQDAGKQNVIILEGKSTKHNGSKKLNKYQLKDLPFPYTNRHQLELNLGHSIGPEFNSRLAHRHLTRPDVLSTPGVVIQPADKPV